jgi:hypothetical protein
VNTASIGKQVVAELKRSPKKAAILGSLLVVAVWFWAPLIQGWLPGGSSKKEAPEKNIAANTEETTATTTAPQGKDKTNKQDSWRKVAKRIAADRRKKPAELPDSAYTNPFGLVEPVAVAAMDEGEEQDDDEEQEEAAAELAKEVEITPNSLGLTLTGTLVGRRARLATIGGRTYRQGEMLRVRRNATAGESVEPSAAIGDEPAIAFVVHRVDVNSVVLAQGNKKYELRLHRLPAAQDGYAVVRTRVEQQP